MLDTIMILEQVCNRVNIPVIISGGAGNYTHFLKAFMSGPQQ